MPQTPLSLTTIKNSLLVRALLFITALQLAVALVTRILLLAQISGEADWSLAMLGAFGIGIWYDLLASAYAALPFWIIAAVVPAYFWHRVGGRLLAATLVGLYTVVFVFISVAEYLFWDEFGVRFNFIAVDYLIFTQEVILNIQQSYPMPLILAGISTLALLVAGLAWRKKVPHWIAQGHHSWKFSLAVTPVFVAMLVGITWAFSQSQLPAFTNDHDRELAKNGMYSFCASFWESEIDYDRFYLKLPLEEALVRAKSLLVTPVAPSSSEDSHDLRRQITHVGPEKRWNVVLISVESLSAEFLSPFGSKKGLTPRLDAMANEGILFRELYATGTRTVRGLEALTLSVPPTPGQSIVWRPKNQHLFTLGSLFAQRGYGVDYIYGGDTRFDNMRSFFGSNGYHIVDITQKTPADYCFANAWGVSDEDLLSWTAKEADRLHSAKQPFFLHAMTGSNHRPFTFPANRIDLPSNSGREAAVKYTDYAIGHFIDEARSKPWFADTLFVVVADHCHGSAGKMELDATKYRIPCIVWNTGLVQPRLVKSMCSQIDVAPTLLGLLNWTYTSRFFGQDVLAPGYTAEHQRAFISNYQKIAMLTRKDLVVLKPKQESSAYHRLDRSHFEEFPAAEASLRPDAIALYQTASWLFRQSHLGEDSHIP